MTLRNLHKVWIGPGDGEVTVGSTFEACPVYTGPKVVGQDRTSEAFGLLLIARCYLLMNKLNTDFIWRFSAHALYLGTQKRRNQPHKRSSTESSHLW